MLSRNQLFRKVSGIAELMDAAHSEWKAVRDSMFSEISITPHVRKELQKEKKILARLFALRKSLREIRDNALFDASLRINDERTPVASSSGPRANTLLVGDRLLELIREDPGFRPLRTPRHVENGVHVGSIHKLKVVHNVSRRKQSKKSGRSKRVA